MVSLWTSSSWGPLFPYRSCLVPAAANGPPATPSGRFLRDVTELDRGDPGPASGQGNRDAGTALLMAHDVERRSDQGPQQYEFGFRRRARRGFRSVEAALRDGTDDVVHSFPAEGRHAEDRTVERLLRDVAPSVARSRDVLGQSFHHPDLVEGVIRMRAIVRCGHQVKIFL
ncbi:hypothetical protein [Streptomyces sp. NPDC003730]